MERSSATRSGLRRVWSVPHAILFEIAWRWAFGLAALAMAALAGERLAGSIQLTSGEIAALRGRDAMMMTAAVMRIWQHAGGEILRVCGIVAVALSLLWLVFASVGRILSLQPLLGVERTQANYAGVFAISFLRVLWLWAALVMCAAVVVASSLAAAALGQPDQPLLALYLLLVFIGLPLVLALWGVVNWYLSIAPVLCMDRRSPAFAALGQTVDAVRAQRARFLSASSAYAAPRIIALVLLIVLAAALAAVLPPGTAAITIIALSLTYFAFADMVYIARLAAYADLLASSDAEPSTPAPAPAAQEAPATQSS